MIGRSFFRPDHRRFGPLTIVTATALFLACSQTPNGQPPVYPIKGKVLYQGKPISGGVVVFELEEAGTPIALTPPGAGPLRATGRIADDGSFRLMAFPGVEGVPAGSYKVGISSMPPRTEGNILDAAASVKKGNPDVLRGKYSDPKSSRLTAQVVTDKPNELTFDLR